MYEEKRFLKRKINWVSVFLKLLLLFLIVFLIWFLIFGRKNNDNKSTKKGKSMEDNLKVLKKDSIKYFNNDRLPKNIGEVKKVTLEEMIKDKATKEVIDKNGQECSKTSSYSQVTKVDENNYSLKVYIKCKNEADSVLTSISTGKKSTNNNKKNTNTNTNNNTNNNKNTNNTNTNSNTNSSTTKKTTTSTNKTTKETTTVTINSNTNNTNTNSNTNTNTTVATNTNTNTNSNTNNNQSTQITEFVPTQENLLYTEYELIKYGDWTTTKPESGKYKTEELKVVVNKYCYGNDNYNCHLIPKTDKYKADIDYLLAQGYKEIYDHTNQTYVYLPYETIWSKTKDVAGYTYTGKYRDVHKMS